MSAEYATYLGVRVGRDLYRFGWRSGPRPTPSSAMRTWRERWIIYSPRSYVCVCVSFPILDCFMYAFSSPLLFQEVIEFSGSDTDSWKTTTVSPWGKTEALLPEWRVWALNYGKLLGFEENGALYLLKRIILRNRLDISGFSQKVRICRDFIVALRWNFLSKIYNFSYGNDSHND